MANELKANYNGTANIYAVIRNRTNAYVWNGSAFVAWTDADIAAYDVPLASQGGDLYTADIPSGVDEGNYYIDYYIRAGSTPATTDIRLSGSAFYWNGTTTATSGDDPTAAEMVSLIKQALRDSPAGVSMITIDGQQVQYSRSQALTELRFWQKEAAREAGTKKPVSSIYLGNF